MNEFTTETPEWAEVTEWGSVFSGEQVKLVSDQAVMIGVVEDVSPESVTLSGLDFSDSSMTFAKQNSQWKLYSQAKSNSILPTEYGTVFSVTYSNNESETFFTLGTNDSGLQQHYIRVSDEEKSESRRLVVTAEEVASCCDEAVITVLSRFATS